jgi:hypothetical protein
MHTDEPPSTPGQTGTSPELDDAFVLHPSATAPATPTAIAVLT